MKTVYVDNNATTRVAPEVVDAMMPYLTERYGNPSSMHSFGGTVGFGHQRRPDRSGRLIGAAPDEIVFTSCGSESDSTAIWAALNSNPGKKHIVTTRVEHPAVKNLCETLTKQRLPGDLRAGGRRGPARSRSSEAAPQRTTRRWSASCGPTMKPGLSFPSGRSREPGQG